MLKITFSVDESLEEVRKALEDAFFTQFTVVDVGGKIVMANQNAVIELEKTSDAITVRAYVCMDVVENVVGICVSKKCFDILIEPVGGGCPYEVECE